MTGFSNLGRANWRQFAGAFLYTTVGGYLDAYAYLAHDHVFANAQTGNVVLLGVHAAVGDWTQAIKHIPPIVAFALGVMTVASAKRYWKLNAGQLRLWSATVEIAVLCTIVGVNQMLPNALVVPMISFAATVQYTSFASIDQWSFNSTMTTGNLRDALSALILWLSKKDIRENRAKCMTLGAVCVSFLIGALLGGLVTNYSASNALVPCIAAVAFGAVLVAKVGSPPT